MQRILRESEQRKRPVNEQSAPRALGKTPRWPVLSADWSLYLRERSIRASIAGHVGRTDVSVGNLVTTDPRVAPGSFGRVALAFAAGRSPRLIDEHALQIAVARCETGSIDQLAPIDQPRVPSAAGTHTRTGGRRCGRATLPVPYSSPSD